MTPIRFQCAVAAEHVRDEITWNLQHPDALLVPLEELKSALRVLENEATIKCAQEGNKTAMRSLAKLCQQWA